MIYITGDTHGDQSRFYALNRDHGEGSWTEEDYLIVCGDFGYLFLDDLSENQFLDDMSARPYTICFVDGNHENFPAIYAYPEEEWHGGKIHRIRRNIVHLMRGQVFDIDGKRFFTMGGAYSIDRAMRTPGETWWPEERPNNDEYNEAVKNLDACGRKVDYILTHTCPQEIILRMGYTPDLHDLMLTGFLDWVMDEVEFRKWYFGHWHEDREIGEYFRLLWFDVVTL